MHPATEHIMQYFEYGHLPVHLQHISKKAYSLAWDMVQQCPENPELTAGLRKLLEAKDCFVRAHLEVTAVMPVGDGIGCFPPVEGSDNGCR